MKCYYNSVCHTPLSRLHLLTLCIIVLYLDLPDLTSLSTLSLILAAICADPALHRLRLRIIAPSRLSHALFGTNPPRPTVAQLVQRNVMKGLGMERRWRAGMYLYSVIVSHFYINIHRSAHEQRY
jgi:hypothetical protein